MTALRFGLGMALVVTATGIVSAQSPSFRTKPLPPPPGEARQVVQPVSASEVLTGQTESAPTGTLPAGPLPAGSVESPWCGATPAGAYTNPIGGNGPVTYELLGYTGPSMPVLGGVLNNRLNVGWVVGTDARTLFFNQTHDAANVLIFGYTYTFNKGRNDVANGIDVATPRQRQAINPDTGFPQFDGNGNPVFERNPIDGLARYTVRSFQRQSFNFGVGRDWWLNGPAYVGAASESNWRFGADLGGRWGTGHIDLVPLNNRENYLRRAGVYHGFYAGTSIQYERTFGNTILYTGLRVQWAYNWMNYVLPQDGDMQDVNILMTLGVRF